MLPYRPEPQPRGGRISAAYRFVGDRLRLEIDTGGRVLEQAWIFRSDGAVVAPHDVEAPPVVVNPGPTISIGVGSSTYRGRDVASTGVGVGIPLGGSTTRTRGNTVVWFAVAQVGPAPWDLYVRVAGLEPTTFSVGGPAAR